MKKVREQLVKVNKTLFCSGHYRECKNRVSGKRAVTLKVGFVLFEQ